MKPTDFITQYATPIQNVCKGSGLFPSVAIAQMALETGWGDSIKTAANNCYGLKAYSSWNGKVISNSTFEIVKGQKIRIQGNNKIYNSVQDALTDGCHKESLFRVYANIEESIADRNNLLLKSARYANVRKAADPENQINEIIKAGYATGNNYVSIIMSIIKKNGLTKYD
jgi:flagellar protein FlgJ